MEQLSCRVLEAWTLPLADMDGIQRDLWFVRDACTALLDRMKNSDTDLVVMESLQSAAMIRYSRCFKEGVRKAFQIPKSWLAALEKKLQEIHADTLILRDKHIAHAVNDWDNHVPELMLTRESPDARPVAIAAWVAYSGTLGLSPDWTIGLRDVSLILASKINDEMEAEKKRIIDQFNSLARDEVERRLKEDKGTIPDEREMHKSRRRS